MMSDDERGRACCYWCLAAIWGLSCLGFITFLFVHSNVSMDASANTIPYPKGYLAIYPGNKIIFNMSNAHISTKKYTEILKNVFEEYQCDDSFETTCENVTQPCKFDTAQLGNACSINNSFGYLERKPCILLRLEKVNSLIPRSADPPEKEAAGIDHDKNHIFVNCRGMKEIDAKRLRTYQIWPPKGFPISTFPALLENHNSSCEVHSPLVAVQFPDLVTGQTISIYCMAWTANYNELATSKIAFSIHIH